MIQPNDSQDPGFPSDISSRTHTHPIVPPQTPKTSRGLLVGIIIGVLFTFSSIIGWSYFQGPPEFPGQLIDTITTTPAPQLPTSAPAVSPTSGPQVTRFGDITWQETPKLITPIAIFKETDKSFYGSKENWGQQYQVASFSDGSKLIDVRLPFEGPGSGYNLFRIVQTPSALYYLSSGLDPWFIQNYRDTFVSQLSPLDMQLEGLLTPDSIPWKNIYFNKNYPSGQFFSELKTPKLLFDSPHGPVYQVINSDIVTEKEIFGKQFYLRLKDSTVVSYQMSHSSDPGKGYITPDITWSDNTKNSTAFSQNLVMSCGGGSIGLPFIKEGSPLLVSKSEVGKISGQVIYQLKDPTNSLTKILYDNYKIGRDYPSAPPTISITDFAARHNHYLIQDAMGDWQIYISSEYSPAAECGKPVIYLYPTKDTQVTVQVAADITKSEPVYPQTGWTVLARPNGQLDYQGRVYPNLFWEGTGHGRYPDLNNQGFGVAQNNLVSTLKSHLSQLGLNHQESADFLEFWLPLMPSTPYIRLTWFGTHQMDQLAPLTVSPIPDSRIRIFLDFQGLDKPTPLTPQKLTAPIRRGFTLVEWGGLLVKPY